MQGDMTCTDSEKPIKGCYSGQLRLLFSLKYYRGRRPECVLLAWLQEDPDPDLEGFTSSGSAGWMQLALDRLLKAEPFPAL